MSTRQFAGKRVFVTGAASGIGRRIAERFCDEGATVLGLDRQAGDNTLPFRILTANLADARQVEKISTGLMADRWYPDILVNAAGVLWFDRDRGAGEMELEVWRRVIDINLTATLLTMKAALPLMKANGGGSIVNISTIQCLRGDTAPQDAYQASKAGVIALTKSIAIQHAADGIADIHAQPVPAWQTPANQQDRERGETCTDKACLGPDLQGHIVRMARNHRIIGPEIRQLRHPFRIGRIGITPGF